MIYFTFVSTFFENVSLSSSLVELHNQDKKFHWFAPCGMDWTEFISTKFSEHQNRSIE